METPTVHTVAPNQAVREERVPGPIGTELANLASTIEKLHARISQHAETIASSLSESGPPTSNTTADRPRTVQSRLGQMLADLDAQIDAAADRVWDLTVRCEL